MFRSSRQIAQWGFTCLLLCLLPVAAVAAEAYPDQPIKIIVTFPPGGSTDIVIRALQPLLTEDLHQTLVIENRSGGSTPPPTSGASERKAPDAPASAAAANRFAPPFPAFPG